MFLLIITISILPWGLRDIKLGADRPFKSCGNQLGNNVCSLNNWVTSFVLTEYEYASIMYPIYDRETGNRKNAKILTQYNPFISKSDFGISVKFLNPKLKVIISKEFFLNGIFSANPFT